MHDMDRVGSSDAVLVISFRKVLNPYLVMVPRLLNMASFVNPMPISVMVCVWFSSSVYVI